MLDKIKTTLNRLPRPALLAGAGLVGLVALAATVGALRPRPAAPEAQPPQAAQQPEPAAQPAAGAPPPETAAGAPSAAPAAAPVVAGLPPAVALDAPQQPEPGAVELVERVADDGTVTPLGQRRIEGQALALVDMATARNATGGAGWAKGGETMRVTRAGLVRVETAGQATMILSNQAGSMRTACALAVGDPGNFVLRGDGGEQAGTVELLAGWHRVFVVASRDGWTDARCRLAIKLASADAATVPDLFDLAKPAAAAPAPTEPEPSK